MVVGRLIRKRISLENAFGNLVPKSEFHGGSVDTSFEKFSINPMLRAGRFEGAMIASLAYALEVSKERSEGRGGLKGMLPVAILDFAAYVRNFAESRRQSLEVWGLRWL